jgi:hypothetical protein
MRKLLVLPTALLIVASLAASDPSPSAKADSHVHAQGTAGPMRVSGLNKSHTLRCTARFPTGYLVPGDIADISLREKNLSDKRVTVPPAHLVYSDNTGDRLWNTQLFSSGGVHGVTIKPGTQASVPVSDVRGRWSGPLQVQVICGGMIRLGPVTLPVAVPTPPTSTDDAVAQAVAVSASPFQDCPPGPGGSATSGSIDPPDATPIPPMSLRCWADVRAEDGFDVVSLQMVSPSGAPDFVVSEHATLDAPPVLPGAAPMLAARWDFVVTADSAIPVNSLTFARVSGSGSTAGYRLETGSWTKEETGTCAASDTGSMSRLGDSFFLLFIADCP